MAKGWLIGGACARAGAVALAVLAGGTVTDAQACLRARDIWCDPQTGFAIGGYDPVAYFVDHAPREGVPKYELTLDGTAWRFANPGNRAAFERDPEIYSPRFGARDPLQLANGFVARGSPLYWLIEDGDLLLFSTPQNRIRWMAAPTMKEKAEANWPRLEEATQ